MKGTRTEHGKSRIHDTGVTTRLGMDRMEIENNKSWRTLGEKLGCKGIGAGRDINPQVRSRVLGLPGYQVTL